MGLVPDQGAVQELAAASPIQRSAIAFYLRSSRSSLDTPILMAA